MSRENGHVTYHHELIQGSDAWLAARCGMLTASEMKLIVTPRLKIARNDKQRAHLWHLLGQRITGYVEPGYVSDDMLRGQNDEIEARALYAKHYAPVQETGLITNDRWGFTLGYSPDGLVGAVGQIEVKSRNQRLQVELRATHVIPPADMIQIQGGMLVSERAWCDYISYCGGMPMITLRVHPVDAMQQVIVAAATAFEQRIADELFAYRRPVDDWPAARFLETERRIEQEILT